MYKTTMYKKSLVMILVLGMFCFSFVSAGNLLTKIDFEISGFSGISALNNSDGTSVVISIFNSSGVVVSRNAVAGVYSPNMTITMSGAKFNLSYTTNYTYNLSTIYGNFLYNFTTPAEATSGASILTTWNDSKSSFTDMGTYVYDSNYGLDWQDGGTGSTLTWADAISYCEELDLGGKAWRLPNWGEAVTLVDFAGGSDGNYLPSAFSEVNNYYYWTSTEVPSYSDDAYGVDLRSGYIDTGDKTDDYTYYARCVSDH